MNKKGDILEFEDGKEYEIADILQYNEKNYVYLINPNDENDLMIQEITGTDDNIDLIPLKNEDEFKTLLDIFYNHNKKEMEDILL